MSILMFDIEADGLLPTIENVWCIVTQDLTTNEISRYPPDRLGEGIMALRSAECLSGHNIIGYDLPALWKIYGKWDSVPLILDTLVVSRALSPERQGGHSLAAWGERLGHPKIDFNEWEQYTDEMLTYCVGDVTLNTEVFWELDKDMREQHETSLQGYKVYT
jgi:DNA polymerase-1